MSVLVLPVVQGLPNDELLACQKIVTYFYSSLILVPMEHFGNQIQRY